MDSTALPVSPLGLPPKLQTSQASITSIPAEVQVQLLAHIRLVYSHSEFRLVSKHFRYMFKTYERSIAAHILEDHFALEAKCFPPTDFIRGYQFGHLTAYNCDRVEEARMIYYKSCCEQGLVFELNSYEYVHFLMTRAEAVESWSHMVVSADPGDDYGYVRNWATFGMDRKNAYRNCTILWSLTEGSSWSASMRAFASLPKKLQLAFGEFLDGLAQKWIDISFGALECAILGHGLYPYEHVNYEDHLHEFYMQQPPNEWLPNDVTDEELRHLRIPALFAKWMILTTPAKALVGPIDGLWNIGYDYEVHECWNKAMSIWCVHDHMGGHFDVKFAHDEDWYGDPIKAFEKALSLPEGVPLAPDWATQEDRDRATATFNRADYWNKEGWTYEYQSDTWCYDWTDLDFSFPDLLDAVWE
ncbi:MAG: hypothetical protein M1836_005179 [Candelina mexicana]|nr:MAG: hypothetical protein M1836_005179 [Candelina mexicana]